jgi:hypothetical protein
MHKLLKLKSNRLKSIKVEGAIAVPEIKLYNSNPDRLLKFGQKKLRPIKPKKLVKLSSKDLLRREG